MANMSIQRTRTVVENINSQVAFALTTVGSDVFLTINGVRYLRFRGNGGDKSGFMSRLRVSAGSRVKGVRHLADGRIAIPKKKAR